METIDRLIRGARVFDGRKFLHNSSVGITGSVISFVGPSAPSAHAVTDASGLILTPAFIDSHTHADFQCLESRNDGNSALSQGVGTLVVGNCGFSTTPGGQPHPLLMPSEAAHCTDLKKHQKRLQSSLPVDVADLLGHGTLRTHVMGEARRATKDEIDKMGVLLDEFLGSGGLGLSVGLNYPEAAGYTEAELIELCKILAKHRRPLTCHIRDQGAGILGAIDEVAGLGEKTGCAVLLSHLRPISDRFDHFLPEIFKRLESRDAINMDLYPYVAGFTTLGWLFQHLFQRLPKLDSLFPTKDVESKAREVCIGGLSDVHILSHQDSNVAGRTISGVAASRGGEPGRVAQEIFLEDPNCLCIYDHESTPEAVDQLITHPKCFIGSDGFLFPTGFQGACHPRSFSTFVGFLVRYVRSGKLTLETGLSKLTGATAEFFHLRDRGEIVVGRKANLTLFNLEGLEEKADFVNPCRPAEGIREVILAGQSVWRNNQVTGDSRAGQRACPAA